jgi:hypothetical protein
MAFDPISAALDIGGKLIDRLWPNPTEAAKAKLELLKLQQEGELQVIAGQLNINAEEAKSSNVFVSGWRPFIGWICGVAFCLHFVFFPIINFILVAFGHTQILIAFDMTTLLTVLGGMLGIGGLRTIEKIQGVTK